MYAACLFCHANLGRNETIPKFPVGSKLAFDSAKGRLWVICTSCARWNLSPFEERWEAIDECERRFRRTRVRISTENIGLVELPEGTSLIRIGKPLFPEFAAWRYGRRFTRRRVKTGLAAGTVVSGALGATVGAVAAGFVGAAFTAAYLGALWVIDEGPKRRPVTKIRYGRRLLKLKQDHAEATRIFSDGSAGPYGLSLHHTEGVELIRGPEVRRILGHVVPTLSPFGGAQQEIRSAIELVDHAGSATECVSRTLDRAARFGGWFAHFPVETRLALEMSLQEDSERRALAGELKALENAWLEAEQIAAIADNLLVPSDVLDRIAGMRGGVERPMWALG